jgi:hypothetical protein
VPYWAGTEKNAKAFVQKKMMPVTTTELWRAGCKKKNKGRNESW